MITRLTHTPRLLRYSLGIVIAAAIVICHLWLSAWTGDRLPFLLFVAALGLTSVLLGMVPAAFVLITGAFYAAWILPPGGSLLIHNRSDQIAMAVYLIVGVVFMVVGKQVTRVTLRAASAERALHEAQLRSVQEAAEAQRRFHSALDSAAVPLWVLSPTPQINKTKAGDGTNFSWDYLNSAALTLLGASGEQLVGRTVDVLTAQGWNTDVLLDQFRACMRDGTPLSFEFATGHSAQTNWHHIIATPLHGAVVVWLANINERKRYEETLRESDRRKDEFLATLAHELRNPLAPIRQAVEIWTQQPVLSEARKQWCFDLIARHSRKMSVLLDELLDVSRITRGKVILRKEAVALDTLLDEAVETVTPLLQRKEHTLKIDGVPDGAVVMVDRLRMGQVIVNLLTNAAKFTPPGGLIVLSSSIRHETLQIQVTDNGAGMAAESLPHIFDLFTQARPADDSEGGLGIGLALSKTLIELHGGTIEAFSDGSGYGSRMLVQVPHATGALSALSVLGAGSPAANDAAEHESGASRAIAPAPNTLHVLVVDDNRDAADALSVLMELEGHTVRTEYDGLAALNTYAQFAPELMLLDLGMPEVDGLQVATAIRALPQSAETTLIAITGWGQESDRLRSRNAGFDHHFTKPVDPVLLRGLINQIAAARNKQRIDGQIAGTNSGPFSTASLSEEPSPICSRA